MSTNMFYNWFRWQCLNRADWNGGEIPAGTMIDHDQFNLFLYRFLRCNTQPLPGLTRPYAFCQVRGTSSDLVNAINSRLNYAGDGERPRSPGLFILCKRGVRESLAGLAPGDAG